jgi:Uma2 family endonuclease
MSGTLHSNETEHPLAPSRRGEPTWELALKYPRQGEWTESDYDLVQQDAFVELVDGCLEFLPMPTPLHQLLVDAFRDLLKAWLKQHSDVRRILTAPCPLRLRQGLTREPDLFLVNRLQLTSTAKTPTGADLTLEVLSPGTENRERDLVAKRHDYAEAGIAEYWIVDPDDRSVRVLVLEGSAYSEHGPFRGDAIAESRLLPEFQVNVAELFAAAESP